MSRLNVSNLFNENEDGAPVVSGISTFSSPYYFVPPSGTTAQRPQNPGEGMIRFNTDSGHLEYYTGDLWVDVITNNNELGDQNNTNSSGGTGTRGVFACGRDFPAGNFPAGSNTIDYVTIDTLGNAQDFGDLSFVSFSTGRGGFGSRTRGVFGGGTRNPGDLINTIEFITFASTGDTTDFGDLSSTRSSPTLISNSTRGISSGGSPTPNVFVNTMEYVTIASTGDAVDFGDAIVSTADRASGASSVRGVYAGGVIAGSPTNTNSNVIDYVTISTTGNSQDFGDLAVITRNLGGAANSTRMLAAGGSAGSSPTTTNTISFITISTTGNAQDFGDTTTALYQMTGTASPTRAVFAGGNPGTNIAQFVTIATTGNAVDFGDMTQTRGGSGACSNGHGGL